MTNRQAGALRHIRHLYTLGALGGTTDARLLALFLAGRGAGAEDAFEVLVERHGPMVLDVCRGVLRDEHAAEDAFQATFLVLARKARSLWVKDSLASWLHGVAHRVASKARSDAVRRRRHELVAAQRSSAATTAPGISNGSQSDEAVILNEEIARLPEKYRAPVVLCYLEAMSYEAAASRLGLTEDTVRGRLARARKRLRCRLIRRGVAVAGLLVGPRPAIRALPYMRPELLNSTVQCVFIPSVAWAPDCCPISATAISLSERVCRTMTRTKLSVAGLTLGLGVITAGALVLAQSPGGPQHEPKRPAARLHPAPAYSGSGGNLIVDWTPVRPSAEKVEIVVDAVRHCIHLPGASVKGSSRPNDGAVRVDLERGKTYKVAVAGEAFMGPATGRDADPFPGVVLDYATDEEDGYAVRQAVLSPGKSITFKTPWAISPNDEVSLMAFFLDTAGLHNRGSYTLTVSETPRLDAFDALEMENTFIETPQGPLGSATTIEPRR